MSHTFFCNNLDCEKEVKEYGMACEDHLSECPGCGMEIAVGANGYCSGCNTEEEPEHVCSGEFDYDNGIYICDDVDYHRQNCECRQSPLCKACVQYFGYDDDEYDGSTYSCTNCRRDFKNKYWRNQFLCRDCEEIENLREQIAAIKKKVELCSHGMTAAQADDWKHMLMLKELRLKALGVEDLQEDDCHH